MLSSRPTLIPKNTACSNKQQSLLHMTPEMIKTGSATTLLIFFSLLEKSLQDASGSHIACSRSTSQTKAISSHSSFFLAVIKIKVTSKSYCKGLKSKPENKQKSCSTNI